MPINRGELYARAWDFFNPSGNAIMKLTPAAAVAVCEGAATRRLVVLRIEGGIRDETGFEARLDCIWDASEAPTNPSGTHENNLSAARFIRNNSGGHNAFIVTVAPLDRP